MPFSFIVISLFVIYLLVFKKLRLIKINTLFAITALTLLLTGYFIDSVNIMNEFTINIMFACTIMFISIELLTRVKLKKVVFMIGAVIISCVGYYLISSFNNDYLTFFNYYPIFVLITGLSLIFVKNANLSVAMILISYLAVEFCNYFIFSNSIGVLNICSYEFLNYAVASVLISLSINFVLTSLKFKSRGQIYEKQN